jgi:hypothetical protein
VSGYTALAVILQALDDAEGLIEALRNEEQILSSDKLGGPIQL